MPNNRGPSKGCRRCRELKVKCDEAKPACQRCQKGSRECIYQADFDRLHRDQNSKAQSIATKKWRQRADFRIEVPTQEYPTDSLAQLAYNRFCYDFMKFPGVIGKLPKILETAAADSCIFTVVKALAHANYHGRYGCQEANEESRLLYGEALQQLAMLMSDPDEMQRDEALMVIFLFSLYEMFTSSKRDGSWITHMQGTQSVIAHRDNTSLKDASSYLSVLCSHLVVYYLTERKCPPPHLDRWIQQIPFEYDSKKRLIILMSDAAKVCYMLEACSSFECSTNQTVLDILNETLELDLRLEGWTADLPPEWSNVALNLVSHKNRPKWSKNLLSGPGAPEKMYTYPNRIAASKWMMCRASRIRLNLTLLEFLLQRPYLKPEYSGLEARTIDLLISLATEISYSLPYFLALSPDGSSDFASATDIPTLWGYMTLWPAYTSSLCLHHRLVRKMDSMSRGTWFRKMIGFLRESIGIAKAQILLNETLTQEMDSYPFVELI
ncbi:unnamed protein product [Penicillium manginii]